MSFTIEQIKDSQSKVKTGGDFPAFVQDLKSVGVKGYNTWVIDGHTIYEGPDGSQLNSGPKYGSLEVSGTSNNALFKNYLQMHQQGKTDFPTFCKHSAETGVEKWRVDISQMTCTYFNKAGEKMLEEKIPGSN